MTENTNADYIQGAYPAHLGERAAAVALVVAADALTYDLRANEDDRADVRRVDSIHAHVAKAFRCLSCGDDAEAADLARSVINEMTGTGEPR